MSLLQPSKAPGLSRRLLLAAPAIVAAAGPVHRARADAPLQKVRMGLPANAIAPVHIDYLVPENLGYYRAEGLTCECVPLGSYATTFANMNSGRLEFTLNASSFELPLLARGQLLDDINFMETTYPFRYGVAVKPGSPIKSVADLKGKRIGDSGPGFATHTVAQMVVRKAGLDPDVDVSWLGVGDGVSGGVALNRGDVDALFYADNGFGLVEAAGVKLTYLPLPDGLPQVGGNYVATTKKMLTEHRNWVVGFGRAIAKGHVFIRENPEAAAFVFGQMVPEALPRAQSVERQIKSLLIPISKRSAFYTSQDPAITKPGQSNDKQWEDEIAFSGLQGRIPPLSGVYTNELVDEINDFDADRIRAEARAYKVQF